MSFREREGEKKRVLKKGEREKKNLPFFFISFTLFHKINNPKIQEPIP